MPSSDTRLFDIDWDAFAPWKISPVVHRLADHPLLRPAPLRELATRLEQVGRIRTHSNAAYAGTSFNHAPMLYPNAKGAAETLADIQHAQAWMSLLNVQTDSVYRQLVDEVLDDLKPRIDRSDPGMCYRGGWIFVTSPNTVTPFHMDKEHNFILQISGTKTLYVWEPDDRDVVSEAARDLFHAHHSRDLVIWREEMRQRARVFHLAPGMGAYMPSTSPHLVENGDGPSITMSFTYYTDSTRRNAMLHAMHQRSRERGRQPAPVGDRPVVDALSYFSHRPYNDAVSAIKRLAGRPTFADNERYAHAQLA